MIELTSGTNDAGRRLDRILRKALPHYPLSLIHRLLRQKKVLVNGMPAQPNSIIQTHDVIQIESKVNGKLSVNTNCAKVNEGNKLSESDIPPILWRDSGIIIFNKPSGLATHGANSLDTMVKSWLKHTLPPSLSFASGPLHRLDKMTSGAVAFSETIDGARLFSRLLHDHKLVKTYLAIVEGKITQKETWQDELIHNRQLQKTLQKSLIKNKERAKIAVTTAQPLACNGKYTLIEAIIATGRTHQIRAQAAAHGHPLAGDVKYGGKRLSDGNFYLHAWKIELPDVMITAPLPAAFTSRLVQSFGQEITRTIN